jgi:hypothetical protein
MKIRAFIFLLTGMTYVLSPGLLAQENTEQVAEKMKSFSWMEGQWKGEAWYIGADRTKTYLIQEETVEARLDGSILTLEGRGSQKNKESQEMKTVFEAFGILTWDTNEAKYVLRAYRGGNFIDSEVLANGDGSYSWFIDLPYGKTRYTLSHSDDGVWNEKGEFSLDGGETWMQTFEMNLTKE